MKIRQGFISNSSSTSFIIAVSAVNKCKVCGRSDLNILNTLNNKEDYNGDGYITALGADGVVAELNREQSYWKDVNERTKQIESIIDKVRKATKAGKEVAMLRIPYHDEYIDIIKSQSNIEILKEENE